LNTKVAHEWASMEFIRVPQGKFIMGSLDSNSMAFEDEKPRHTLHIPYDYYVERFPLRNSQYAVFVGSTAYITRAEREGWAWVWISGENSWEKVPGANWINPLGSTDRESQLADHPVVQICWYDALAYCAWLNEIFHQDLPPGYRFSLPNEAEWEKAARGPDGREWPWGNEFDSHRCNSFESGNFVTTPVDAHSPAGDSVYSIADMCGNVWEWTLTLWGEDRNRAEFVYPYTSADGRESLQGGEHIYRIIRGGSFKNDQQAVRAACRDLDPEGYSLSNLGMRVFVVPADRDNLHYATELAGDG